MLMDIGKTEEFGASIGAHSVYTHIIIGNLLNRAGSVVTRMVADFYPCVWQPARFQGMFVSGRKDFSKKGHIFAPAGAI